MKKKICWSVLIIVLIFNSIFTNFVYATDDDDEEDTNITYTEEDLEELTDSGETSYGTVSSSTSSAAGATNMITSIASGILAPLTLLSVVVNNGGLYRTASEYSAANVIWFNLGSLVFDEYLMFNIDITKTASGLNPSATPTLVTKAIDTIKNLAVGIYRYFSLGSAIVFAILAIYTLIRMFLANTATDKAKFKKMIGVWVKAILFMALASTIIVLTNILWARLMDGLNAIRLSLEDAGYAGFESALFKACREGYLNYSGFKAAAFFIELVLFMIIDFIFFGKYFVRSFMIILLVVMVPIYAIVDVIKKLGNGNGVLNTWFNQYMSYVFIQPLHALMYIVFMITLGNIAEGSPLVGLFLLYALLTAEKIGKTILGFSKETIGSLLPKDK